MKVSRKGVYSVVAVAMFCTGAACGGGTDLIDVTHGAEPGTSGGGSPSGSGSSSGSGTSPGGGECSALADCCAQLGTASNITVCNQLVEENLTQACAEALSDFEADQLCNSISTSGSGSGPIIGSGSGSACGALDECCPALPSVDEEEECEEIVSLNDPTECNAVYESFCFSTGSGSGTFIGSGTGGFGGSGSGTFIGSGTGSFGGSGTGTSIGSGSGPSTAPCLTLENCCNVLPSSDEAACEDTAAANNPAQCQSVLVELQGEGFCNTNG
jgi:hypothetical protein